METIIFGILIIVGIILVTRLLFWLTDIVIKVAIGIAGLLLIAFLFDFPIPPVVIDWTEAGLAFIREKAGELDFSAIKEKLAALLKLIQENSTGNQSLL